MKPSVLRTLIATIVLVAATSALAQKKDPVSPNEPKVTICHNGHSITVAQSAVPAHLAHGDAVGACASEANVLICHRGRTISVAQSAVPAHLAHGDTAGECSAVARSQITAPLPSAVPVSAPVAPVAPVALAKPVAPATPPTVQTPVINDDVAVCYKGSTVNVSRTSIQTYLSIGATLGPCNQQQRSGAAPATEEVKDSTEEAK